MSAAGCKTGGVLLSNYFPPIAYTQRQLLLAAAVWIEELTEVNLQTGTFPLVIDHEGAQYDLRLASPDDAAAYVDFLHRNWARFREAMPTAFDGLYAADSYRCRFSEPPSAATEPKAIFIVLADPGGRILGDVSFSNMVFGPLQACHLSFAIDGELEGAGIMKWAVESCCAFMFTRFGLHRIMANYRPENIRSGALLKRLGFEVEGFARGFLHLDGDWRDHVLTSLVSNPGPTHQA